MTRTTEYTVHFRKVGRLNMYTVEAPNAQEALRLARAKLTEQGWKLVRIDHFALDGRLVIDL